MFYHSLIIWLRRLLITIWFWLWASIATLCLQIAVFAFQAKTHDSITLLIENIMANIVFLAMTLPGIWKVESYETLDHDEIPKGPFLLASNHNSIVDTLFIALYPRKKSYTFNLKWSWVPIFGPLCVKAGYIGIDSSSPEQKAKVVPNVIKAMQAGYSIMIYPQGSRSLTPEAQLKPSDLKHGTFTIAKESGFQILPIAIKGSDKAMLRGGWCDVATIVVITGKPISVTDVEQGKIDYCNIINNAMIASLKVI